MRLIDVDELIKSIEQGEGFSWYSHGKDDLCVRKKYIDNAPTVEPTFGLFRAMFCETCQAYATNRAIAKLADEYTSPHGKWVYRNDNSLIPSGYWECSVCGIGKQLVESNFCPYCGSDNRGEDHD